MNCCRFTVDKIDLGAKERKGDLWDWWSSYLSLQSIPLELGLSNDYKTKDQPSTKKKNHEIHWKSPFLTVNWTRANQINSSWHQTEEEAIMIS